MKPIMDSSDSDTGSDVTTERSPKKKTISKPSLIDEGSTSSSDVPLVKFVKKKPEVTATKSKSPNIKHASPKKKQNISPQKVKSGTKVGKTAPSKAIDSDSDSSSENEATKVSPVKSAKKANQVIDSEDEETPSPTNKKNVGKQQLTPDSDSEESNAQFISFASPKNSPSKDEVVKKSTEKKVAKKKAPKKIIHESSDSQDSSDNTLTLSPSKSAQPMNDSSDSDSEKAKPQKMGLKRKRSNNKSLNGESPQSKLLKEEPEAESNGRTSASSDDVPLKKYVTEKVPSPPAKKPDVKKGRKLSEKDITDRLEDSSESSDSESSEEEEKHSSLIDSSSDSEIVQEEKHSSLANSSSDSEPVKEEKKGKNKASKVPQKKKKNEPKQSVSDSEKEDSKAQPIKKKKKIAPKLKEEKPGSEKKKVVKASSSGSESDSEDPDEEQKESKGNKKTNKVAETKKPTDDPRIARLQKYLKLAGKKNLL